MTKNDAPEVAASAPLELAWLLNLSLESAAYGAPAVDELERTLLPGIEQVGASLRGRFSQLWRDELTGCLELVYAAHSVGAIAETDTGAFLDRLRQDLTGPIVAAKGAPPQVYERLRRLVSDTELRRDYVDLLRKAWRPAERPWRRSGLETVAAACAWWRDRLRAGIAVGRLVGPRHPLLRMEPAEALARPTAVVVTPLYFCMSGGMVVDLGDHVRIGVPASGRHPARRRRDAQFVAERTRVLADPTRVRLLIHLLGGPASVTELARSLACPQASVSDHLKMLRLAGLLEARRAGRRTLYSASLLRVARLLEDVKSTLAGWR